VVVDLISSDDSGNNSGDNSDNNSGDDFEDHEASSETIMHDLSLYLHIFTIVLMHQFPFVVGSCCT
jgi:hypothetical protein